MLCSSGDTEQANSSELLSRCARLAWKLPTASSEWKRADAKHSPALVATPDTDVELMALSSHEWINAHLKIIPFVGSVSAGLSTER